MKKILTLFIILISLVFLISFENKNSVVTDLNKSQIKNEKKLSMMLETDVGSDKYEMVTMSSWPTEGYVFNSELSGCENGGKLYWSDAERKVIMESNSSDKCYVYFDREENKVLLVDYVKSLYTGTQGENSIYYHDSNLANGASDNSYRFAGASNQVNNFVCFGTDESPCPTDNLYRIIGVFEDIQHGITSAELVKLIKYDYITTNQLGTNGDYTKIYSGSSTYYKGENLQNIAMYHWSISNLFNINLNTNFVSYLNNSDKKWNLMVQDITWKSSVSLPDYTMNSIPLNAYKNELISPKSVNTFIGKYGLMYVSDYGFAMSPNAWAVSLESAANYNNVNWLFMGVDEWTITSNYTYVGTYMIGYEGTFYSGFPNGERSLRPSFFLTASTNYVSGTGTQADPIILS